MDSQSQAPYKSSSFSPATTRDDAARSREVDRNFSLGALRDKRDHPPHHHTGAAREHAIKEEDEQEDGVEGTAGHGEDQDLAALSAEVDAFVAGQQDGDAAPVTVTEATLEKFTSAVELLIARSEGSSDQDKWAAEAGGYELRVAITRIATLASALGKSAPEGGGKHTDAMHRVTGVLHRAMAHGVPRGRVPRTARRSVRPRAARVRPVRPPGGGHWRPPWASTLGGLEAHAPFTRGGLASPAPSTHAAPPWAA